VVRLTTDRVAVAGACAARDILKKVRDILNTLFYVLIAAIAVLVAAAIAAFLIPFFGWATGAALLVAAGVLTGIAIALKVQIDSLDQRIAELDQQIAQAQNDFAAGLGEFKELGCLPPPGFDLSIPACPGEVNPPIPVRD
jgi:hypothetical protein